MKRSFFGVSFALGVLCAFGDDWREEMWEHPVRLRDGVSVRAYALDEPQAMKAYVVRVDLTTPGIGFAATERCADWGREMTEYTNAVIHAETKSETTADFLRRRRGRGENVAVAFNTTPWKPFPAPRGVDACDPQGWCVAEGVEVSAHGADEALFVVRKDGTCEITPSVSPDEEKDVAFAANAFDLILTNGVDVATVRRPEDEAPRPRLAVGLTADGQTLVVLAVDGRQPGYSSGATFADLRAILRREGVTDAVNMDGGGSTSLVVWDGKNGRPWMLNRHKNGKVRANAVNFGVTFAGEDVREVERTAAAFHSYAFKPIVDTPAPEGFKPFYVAHYGRHGSRRLTGTFVEEALGALAKAEAAGDLTDEGKALLSDLRAVARAHEGMVGQLSERGAEEHRRLARRMAARFPDVFTGERRVRCRSSVFPRVLVSQANFTMALKDCASGLSFDYTTGEKVQKVVNPMHWAKTDEDKAKRKKKVEALAAAEINPAPLVGRLFLSAQTEAPVTFARNLFACASICPCVRDELDGLDLYRHFTPEEIDALGRVLAAEHYSGMGNSVEFGDVATPSARILLGDIVARADEAIADDRIAADLRFGHDAGLWPLASLMGLEGPDEKCAVAEAADRCPAWKWMPMAANFQMVFYRDKAGDVLAKILWNEEEMRVRGLDCPTAPYYPWATLRERLKAKMDGRMETEGAASVPAPLVPRSSCGGRHGTVTEAFTNRLDAFDAGVQDLWLRFEGAGTYVTATLNGIEIARRLPVGRVSRHVLATAAARPGENVLEVVCEHPEKIADVPWICGGCFDEPGFCEGIEPMGVFRPIRWEVTGKSRIAPDGVCAWMEGGEVVVATETWGAGELETAFNGQTARCEASGCVTQRFSAAGVELWRVGAPRLYEIVSRFGGCETKTVTGFRDESQKVFVNGVNDWYGGEDDPAAQAQRVLELGFNAYRDGHEPQDLRLARLWAENGVLWWPQFSTHVWFDTPAFRRNFKEMLARWVKERRNNPAVVLWGLQNESSLPKEFAEDCTALIHSLDPRGRKVTTCNYGEGTDWNVVQNWSGTYGGDPSRYGEELSRPEQLLNGEYGAYNTNETAQAELLHLKMCEAVKVRDRVAGHFLWLLHDHENPGRAVPVNRKGLLSLSNERYLAWYLYRAWGKAFAEGWEDKAAGMTWREMVDVGRDGAPAYSPPKPPAGDLPDAAKRVKARRIVPGEPFHLGVASSVALRLRYVNASGRETRLAWRITRGDDELAKGELALPTTTRKPKRTTTIVPTLNAGTYILGLSPPPGVRIVRVEIE